MMMLTSQQCYNIAAITTAIEGNDADIATNVTNIAANTTAIEEMMLTSQRMLQHSSQHNAIEANKATLNHG